MAKSTGIQEPKDTSVSETLPKVFSRDELRALVFDPEKSTPKRVPFTFNGAPLEWVQPTIEDAEVLRDKGGNYMVQLIIAYTRLRGTDEHVFDDGDYDSLMKMPMNGEFQDLIGKISEAISLKVDEKVKN